MNEDYKNLTTMISHTVKLVEEFQKPATLDGRTGYFLTPEDLLVFRLQVEGNVLNRWREVQQAQKEAYVDEFKNI